MTIFFRVRRLAWRAVSEFYQCAYAVPVYNLCPIMEAKLRIANLVLILFFPLLDDIICFSRRLSLVFDSFASGMV